MQILSHARKLDLHLDADLVKDINAADTRKLKKLRRLHRATNQCVCLYNANKLPEKTSLPGGEHDLLACICSVGSPAVNELHPTCYEIAVVL